MREVVDKLGAGGEVHHTAMGWRGVVIGMRGAIAEVVCWSE